MGLWWENQVSVWIFNLNPSQSFVFSAHLSWGYSRWSKYCQVWASAQWVKEPTWCRGIHGREGMNGVFVVFVIYLLYFDKIKIFYKYNVF